MKSFIFLFAIGSIVLGQNDSTEIWKNMSIEELNKIRNNYNQEIARVNRIWNEYRDKSKTEQNLTVAQQDADRMDEAKTQLEILENHLSIIKGDLSQAVSNEKAESDEKQTESDGKQQERWEHMTQKQLTRVRDSIDNLTIGLARYGPSLKRYDSLNHELNLINSIITDFQEKASETQQKERRINRIKNLKEKYSTSEFKDQILKHHLAIGMTKEMVIDSWGKPDEVNRTVGSWGVHEQWVYGETYLYIENDTLTSFQDRK
jgi:DNA repair exonuclease SbcCD ATPase subunit